MAHTSYNATLRFITSQPGLYALGYPAVSCRNLCYAQWCAVLRTRRSRIYKSFVNWVTCHLIPPSMARSGWFSAPLSTAIASPISRPGVSQPVRRKNRETPGNVCGVAPRMKNLILILCHEWQSTQKPCGCAVPYTFYTFWCFSAAVFIYFCYSEVWWVPCSGCIPLRCFSTVELTRTFFCCLKHNLSTHLSWGWFNYTTPLAVLSI